MVLQILTGKLKLSGLSTGRRPGAFVSRPDLPKLNSSNGLKLPGIGTKFVQPQKVDLPKGIKYIPFINDKNCLLHDQRAHQQGSPESRNEQSAHCMASIILQTPAKLLSSILQQANKHSSPPQASPSLAIISQFPTLRNGSLPQLSPSPTLISPSPTVRNRVGSSINSLLSTSDSSSLNTNSQSPTTHNPSLVQTSSNSQSQSPVAQRLSQATPNLRPIPSAKSQSHPLQTSALLPAPVNSPYTPRSQPTAKIPSPILSEHSQDHKVLEAVLSKQKILPDSMTKGESIPIAIMMKNIEKAYNLSKCVGMSVIAPPKILGNSEIDRVKLVQTSIDIYADAKLYDCFDVVPMPQFIDGSNIEFVMDSDNMPVKVGKGVNGSVFLGLIGQTLVAIKCGHRYLNGFCLRDFLLETCYMSAMNNSGSSPVLYGISHMDIDGPYAPLCMVMQFLGDSTTGKSQTLRDVLAAGCQLNYSLAQWLDLVLSVIDCMKALKDRNLTMNDIKSDNFLVFEGKVYVIDYGFARHVGAESPYYVPDITDDELDEVMVKYNQIAPELYVNNWTTEKCDMYGLGAVLKEFKQCMGYRPMFQQAIDMSREADPETRADIEDVEFIIKTWRSVQ